MVSGGCQVRMVDSSSDVLSASARGRDGTSV